MNIKVEGKLYPLGNTGLPSGMVKKIAYSLMDEGQVPQFERNLELNMALAVKEAGRFRINVFKQRGEVGMVIRAIKSEIPSIDQLQLPRDLPRPDHGAARTDPGGRRHRLGQVDHAGGDDRSSQPALARATSSPSRIRSSTCTGTSNPSSTSAKSAWTRTAITRR